MKSLPKFLIGALVLGATGSLLYAAPGDGTSADEAIVPASKQAVMSGEEMRVRGGEAMKTMKSMLRHVIQLREKAAKEKDILKLNCLNDKLVLMKGELNLGDSTYQQLEVAVSSNDETGRYALYADITTSFDKTRNLRDEADACVGDALTYIGKTDVQVTGPENPLDPSGNPFDPGIEPPVYKTPFD